MSLRVVGTLDAEWWAGETSVQWLGTTSSWESHLLSPRVSLLEVRNGLVVASYLKMQNPGSKMCNSAQELLL